MAAPISLEAALQKRQARIERRGLALAIQSEPDVVRAIVGNADDGVELAMSPELAEEIAAELVRASAAARKR